MTHKYVIVESCNREFNIYTFDNVDDAKAKLKRLYEDATEYCNADDGDCAISNDCTSAWANVQYEYQYDWEIFIV